MIKKTTLSLVLLATVAACSDDSKVMSFAESAITVKSLANDLSKQSETDMNKIETKGKATYTGKASFGHYPGKVSSEGKSEPSDFRDLADDTTRGKTDVVADINLDVNFDDSKVSGKIDQFISSDNKEIEGSVNIAQTEISGGNFSANLDGKYGKDNADVAGNLEGAFFGEHARIVAGSIDLNKKSDSSDVLDGYFAAQTATPLKLKAKETAVQTPAAAVVDAAASAAVDAAAAAVAIN